MEEKICGKSGLVYLRLMEGSDTEKIVEWRNNPRVRNNFIYQKPFTAEGHLNWIETQVKPGHVVQFIICENESGCAVGSVYFRDIDKDNAVAEYGIFIGEDDAVGKGYGTLAAQLALEYAFKELKLKSVFLRAFEDNISAIRSYDKAGFKLLKDRQDMVMINGIERKVIFMEANK